MAKARAEHAERVTAATVRLGAWASTAARTAAATSAAAPAAERAPLASPRAAIGTAELGKACERLSQNGYG
eukprot:3727120-Pyramimonas_sp.AAC.1